MLLCIWEKRKQRNKNQWRSMASARCTRVIEIRQSNEWIQECVIYRRFTNLIKKKKIVRIWKKRNGTLSIWSVNVVCDLLSDIQVRICVTKWHIPVSRQVVIGMCFFFKFLTLSVWKISIVNCGCYLVPSIFFCLMRDLVKFYDRFNLKWKLIQISTGWNVRTISARCACCCFFFSFFFDTVYKMNNKRKNTYNNIKWN